MERVTRWLKWGRPLTFTTLMLCSVVACDSAQVEIAVTPVVTVMMVTRGAVATVQATPVATGTEEPVMLTVEATVAPAVTLTVDSPTVTATALVGEGPVVVFARGDDLWVATVDGGAVQRVSEGGVLDWGMERAGDGWWRAAVFNRPVRVSPDGRWAAFSQTGQNMVVVDLTRVEPPRMSGPDGSIADWSPDSQYLAYGVHRLVVYDVARDEREVVLSGYGGGMHQLVWSPDNRYIAFACCFQEGGDDGVRMGEIQRVEVANGQVETVGETTSSIGGGVPAVCWTADGQVVTELENHVRCSYSIRGSVLSPDGRWAAVLAIAAEDGEGPSLLSVREVGSEVVVWERPVVANRVKWSPDGAYLLLDDNRVDSPIWRVRGDGTGEVEVVVADGFLVDVVGG